MSNTANTKLQWKLRAMIDADGLTKVGRQLDIGSEALARYLADIYLYTSTFRGIEASLAAAQVDAIPARKPRAPTELQLKLRAMIDADGLTKVSRRLEVGRAALARYLADLDLHVSSFRGIEATVAAAQLDRPPRASKEGRAHALSR